MCGIHGIWWPLTLNPKPFDKPSKVECKFYNIVISYCKDIMLFHLSYWHDGNGQVGVVMCSKAHAQVKALFSNCEGIVPWPPNDIFVPTLNGSIHSMAIKMPNPLVEGKSISVFQVEGVQISKPPTNNIKGVNRSINNDIQTFQHVSILEWLNLAQKKKLDKKWVILLYELNIPFNVVWHPTFIKVVKATFKFQSHYKPPSYHGLHIYLLKKSKVDVSKHIYEKAQNSIHKFEVTIYSNGWDNVAWRPLLNIMLVCSNGDVFVGAIDTTSGHKDA